MPVRKPKVRVPRKQAGLVASLDFAKSWKAALSPRIVRRAPKPFKSIRQQRRARKK